MIGRRVLVTGGAGFLGSHLCQRLVDAGHEVLAVDNFFTGTRRNVSHLVGDSNFELLRHDLTFPLFVEVDTIFNLACPASPRWYQRDPVQTVKTSVMGAINVLGLAKRVGATVIQASTSEVYGDPTLSPQPEDYRGNVSITGPRACYDEGKRAAETLFYDYGRQYSVDARVVRIFNTYGPRMALDDGRVVSNFVAQAIRGEPLTIYGDGRQTRSFCYVEDLVEGLMRVAELPSLVGPINLGSDHEISVLQLAEEVAELAGIPLSYVNEDLPLDDPKQRQPDLTRARSLLDWSPRVDLTEGLTSTIDHFREQIQPG